MRYERAIVEIAVAMSAHQPITVRRISTTAAGDLARIGHSELTANVFRVKPDMVFWKTKHGSIAETSLNAFIEMLES